MQLRLAAQAGGADHAAGRDVLEAGVRFETKASSGFSRAEMATSANSGSRVIGTSFME
jgi:hypothetical protein